jgi:hypothetical protein
VVAAADVALGVQNLYFSASCFAIVMALLDTIQLHKYVEYRSAKQYENAYCSRGFGIHTLTHSFRYPTISAQAAGMPRWLRSTSLTN